MLRRYASTDPPVGGTAFRAEDERPWSRNQAFFLRNAICFSQVSFFFPERDGLLILFINCGVGGGGVCGRSRFVSKQEKFYLRCTPRLTGPQSRDTPPKRGDSTFLCLSVPLSCCLFSLIHLL